MADIPMESIPLPGEKRKSSETSESASVKKPVKIRRFDMAPVLPLTASQSSSSVSVLSVSDFLNDTSSNLHISAKIVKTSLAVPEELTIKPSVNQLLKQSLHLNQVLSETGSKETQLGKNVSKSLPHLSSTTSIVDNLFKDFIASKIQKVDDGPPTKTACNKNGEEAILSPSAEETRAYPTYAMSIEEINRLLDAEISSIKSRGIVSSHYDDADDDSNCGHNDKVKYKHKLEGDTRTDKPVTSDIKATVSSDLNSTVSISNHVDPTLDQYHFKKLDSLQLTPIVPTQITLNSNLTEKTTGTIEDIKQTDLGDSLHTSQTLTPLSFEASSLNSGDEGRLLETDRMMPTTLFGKKTQVCKKLGLSIGQESLARILGTTKTERKGLEDGEVASSTDTEEDKIKKGNDDALVESEDSDDDISETGSLSDSDKEKGSGKESKTKKKKKHKHKHRKKKKHKSQSKEKLGRGKDNEKSSSDKEERVSRKEKEDEDSKKESKLKEKRKHCSDRRRSDSQSERRSRSRSKSRSHSKTRRSKSPRSRHTSDPHSHSRDDRKSREKFDPWDARSYRGTDDRLLEHSRHKSRSRSTSRDKRRSRSRSRSHERFRKRSRERSQDRWHDRGRGDRRGHGDDDDDGDKDDLRIKIDKTKLRKIAIANALAKMETGQGPPVDLTTVKCGGKSVAELTDFCKRISQQDKHGANEVSDSDTSDEVGEKSDPEDSLIHHPFKLRDPSSQPNIILNIRNAKQLPVLTPQEKQTQVATLRTQFPVSSGAQHRSKESEWVPVTPSTTAAVASTKASIASATTAMPSVSGATIQQTPAAATVVANVPAPPVAQEESVFPAVNQQVSGIVFGIRHQRFKN